MQYVLANDLMTKNYRAFVDEVSQNTGEYESRYVDGIEVGAKVNKWAKKFYMKLTGQLP